MRSRIPKGLVPQRLALALATVGNEPRNQCNARRSDDEGRVRGRHQGQEAWLGRSSDIAARYGGQANAVATLSKKCVKAEKERSDGADVPNPPDKISDADLKAAVEYIPRAIGRRKLGEPSVRPFCFGRQGGYRGQHGPISSGGRQTFTSGTAFRDGPASVWLGILPRLACRFLKVLWRGDRRDQRPAC